MGNTCRLSPRALVLYAGGRERVEYYPQVWYFLFSPFSSPLWLCSLKQKHKYTVLIWPIKKMGRRDRCNVHLVVIDYGHLVRQQPFHIMSDHKLPRKAVSVWRAACSPERQERGAGWDSGSSPQAEAPSSWLVMLLEHDVSRWSSVRGHVMMSAHLSAEGRQDLTQHLGTSGHLCWSGSRFGCELEAAVA